MGLNIQTTGNADSMLLKQVLDIQTLTCRNHDPWTSDFEETSTAHKYFSLYDTQLHTEVSRIMNS